MRRALRWLALLTAALFAALAVVSKLWLEPAGLPIFDARFAGYDLAAARGYLGSLPDSGRAIYLGIYRWLDSLLPLALGILLAGLAWRLGAGLVRVALILLALGYFAADLLENAAVAQLLRAAEPEAAAVARASGYTQAKWLCLTLSVLFWCGIWVRQRLGKGRVS